MSSRKGRQKSNEPSVFELQLEQYKTELKTSSRYEDKTKSEELKRYIRNLESIVRRLKNVATDNS